MAMRDVGSMADQAARALREEHEKEIRERPLPFEDDVNVMEKKGVGVFSKLEFKWKESDRKILDQIEAANSAAFSHLFHDSITILDDLYGQIRVPKTRDVDGSTVVVTDEGGRPIWETDAEGKPLENWDNLDGVDIERCLFDLTRLRLLAAPKVNSLLMQAMFAKRIHTDTYDDAYTAMWEGTVHDKTSKANRDSREANYHAFYRYWLWTQGDVFLKELSNFQRVLERVRDWGVRSQWR